ncbi:MAG: tRNA 2-selenouridine synthase [Betaproteobacteria bacterium SG8_39]|nr:MAG: tRNA 2-selenouridine synthase [Betaproteobacteria bacterium SG8_39]
MRSSARTSVAMSAPVLSSFDAIIDVRSPSEFAEDHLPGALNLPVLDDTERAHIGTLYKQVSPFEAKRVGAALVARNIARHVEGPLAGMTRGWCPLIYCWRGGKRSGALAHVLREIGWEAKTLEGGYKAYRRHVVESLERLPRRFLFRVVHGVTGSGKSRLLAALAEAGAQVLDLEGLAEHRGSVLGALPGRAQPSQKLFESRLLAALGALDPARPVFVEGESRRIGQVQLPGALIETMRAAACLRLVAGLETRVALLLEEYRHFFAERSALEAQLDCLVDLHSRATVEEWKALAAQGDWGMLVQRLLAEHYDPAYRRSATRNFPRLAEAETVALSDANTEDFARIARRLASGGAPERDAHGAVALGA